jgi:hypothetical protein
MTSNLKQPPFHQFAKPKSWLNTERPSQEVRESSYSSQPLVNSTQTSGESIKRTKLDTLIEIQRHSDLMKAIEATNGHLSTLSTSLKQLVDTSTKQNLIFEEVVDVLKSKPWMTESKVSHVNNFDNNGRTSDDDFDEGDDAVSISQYFEMKNGSKPFVQTPESIVMKVNPRSHIPLQRQNDKKKMLLKSPSILPFPANHSPWKSRFSSTTKIDSHVQNNSQLQSMVQQTATANDDTLDIESDEQIDDVESMTEPIPVAGKRKNY